MAEVKSPNPREIILSRISGIWGSAIGGKPGDSDEDASCADVKGNGNGCGPASWYELNVPLP